VLTSTLRTGPCADQDRPVSRVHRARPVGTDTAGQRWEFDWRPRAAGPVELLARATDIRGNTQPDTAVFNTLGYLFDAVVRHPVTVA